jgi:hypothetical protein
MIISSLILLCLSTPSSSPSFQHNNNNKSDLSKPDSSKVKRLASNVISSLQKNVVPLNLE